MNTIKIISLAIALAANYLWAENPSIMIVAPINGQVSPCQCGGREQGGLAKIHTFSRKYQGSLSMLFNGNNFDLLGSRHKNRLVSRQLGKMGLTAVGVGWAELKGGLEYFAASDSYPAIPWVNCNLLLRGKPLADKCILAELNGNKYAITGAVSESRIRSPLLSGLKGRLKVLPPVKCVLDELSAHGEKADLLVVLSDMTVEDEVALSANYTCSKPLLIITSNGKKGPDTLRTSKNTAVLNPGKGGRQGWQAEYIVQEEKFKFVKMPIDTAIQGDPDVAAAVDIYTRVFTAASGENEKPLPESRIDQIIKKKRQMVLFYSPDCEDCRDLIEDDLAKASGKIRFGVDYIDITQAGNYGILVALQKKTGIATRQIPVAFYQGKFYDGKEAIIELVNNLF